MSVDQRHLLAREVGGDLGGELSANSTRAYHQHAVSPLDGRCGLQVYSVSALPAH